MLFVFMRSASAFTLALFGTAVAQEVQLEAGQTFGRSAARSASLRIQTSGGINL